MSDVVKNNHLSEFLFGRPAPNEPYAPIYGIEPIEVKVEVPKLDTSVYYPHPCHQVEEIVLTLPKGF